MATDTVRAATTGDCCTHGEVRYSQNVSLAHKLLFYIQLLGSDPFCRLEWLSPMQAMQEIQRGVQGDSAQHDLQYLRKHLDQYHLLQSP